MTKRLRERAPDGSVWTARDTAFAAKLYSLAVLANADGGDHCEDIHDAVAMRSIKDATKELARMGFEPGELSTMARCIKQTIARRPRRHLKTVPPPPKGKTP